MEMDVIKLEILVVASKLIWSHQKPYQTKKNMKFLYFQLWIHRDKMGMYGWGFQIFCSSRLLVALKDQNLIIKLGKCWSVSVYNWYAGILDKFLLHSSIYYQAAEEVDIWSF